jgi:hypothetical protein
VPEDEINIERHDAAIAVARHCALVRMPPTEIAERLIDLAEAIPAWRPTDPEDIADLVTAIQAEVLHGH